MFNVNVNYQNNNTTEENKAVRQMYTQTRNYGEVCCYFADFGLCDDAMLAWAIELGWDIESVKEKIEEILGNNLYSAENPQYNFFYEIVNDAIGFIDSHLSNQTENS